MHISYDCYGCSPIVVGRRRCVKAMQIYDHSCYYWLFLLACKSPEGSDTHKRVVITALGSRHGLHALKNMPQGIQIVSLDTGLQENSGGCQVTGDLFPSIFSTANRIQGRNC